MEIIDILMFFFPLFVVALALYNLLIKPRKLKEEAINATYKAIEANKEITPYFDDYIDKTGEESLTGLRERFINYGFNENFSQQAITCLKNEGTYQLLKFITNNYDKEEFRNRRSRENLGLVFELLRISEQIRNFSDSANQSLESFAPKYSDVDISTRQFLKKNQNAQIALEKRYIKFGVPDTVTRQFINQIFKKRLRDSKIELFEYLLEAGFYEEEASQLTGQILFDFINEVNIIHDQIVKVKKVIRIEYII